MITWSTAFPVTEILLETWHPLAVTVGRLLLGGLLLTLIIILTGKARVVLHAPWRNLFIVGGLALGVGTICLNYGLALSSPLTAAIIITTMPAVALVVEVICGDQRMTLRLLIGISLAIAGSAWASLYGRSDELGFAGGEPLLFFAVLFFVWYSRAAITLLPTLPPIAKSGLTLTVGGIVVGVVVIPIHLLGYEIVSFDLAAKPVALMLWTACICNGLSMALWLSSVEKIGMTVAAIHMNMVPFYVMLCVLALGSTVSPGQTYGAVLVVAGVVISQWRRPVES